MSNQTILLIDYDPASISRTATPLTKAGYQVEVAKDGLSGLAAFERMKPSLVLVEAMLPRKHGFEVCQEIKAKPEGKSTPVLITTAVCRGRKYRMDALQIYGCDEYIEKPITDDELLSMVARFIEQANQAREEIQQDLSDAIDTVAADVPVAIESMDDDELEAKIDALLMGGDDPAQDEEIPAPQVEQAELVVAAEPVAAAVAVAPETPQPGPAVEPVEAVPPVDPASIDLPAEEVTALPVQAPPAAEEPVADPLAAEIEPQIESPSESEPAPEAAPEIAIETAVEPEKQEWTETPTQEKMGGSKVVLFGVAAVVVLGVLGFLAFQQGWIGETSAFEAAPTDATDNASRLANHASAAAIRPPVQDGIDLAAAGGFAPAEVEAEPVEAQPEPVEPEPVVPSKPTFKPRSSAELKAARDRQARADRAMSAAAGTLETQLLSGQASDSVAAQDEPNQAVDVVGDDLLGTPIRPKAQRGELFALNEVDQVPVPIRFEQPAYDELARRSNQEGVVVVEVLIDETGRVSETRLVQEIPRSRLNDAALRAAERWTYKPAMKDGVPVMVWKSERIVFELE